MMKQFWDSVEAAFFEAKELGQEEGAEMLEKLFPDRPDLIRQVAELLEADRRVGNRLEAAVEAHL